MSIKYSSPEQILGHPMNTSSAKFCYTIKKDRRFRPHKPAV
jgi:hypothetical protein